MHRIPNTRNEFASLVFKYLVIILEVIKQLSNNLFVDIPHSDLSSDWQFASSLELRVKDPRFPVCGSDRQIYVSERGREKEREL